MYCGTVQGANAPGCTAAEGLLYKPLVFSHSYLHRQVSPPETLVVKGGTNWARNGRWILPEKPDFHVTFRDLLHVVNLRHGTNGFTSFPKEGVLRIFFALKNPTASAGTKGQHATPRPLKPLMATDIMCSFIDRFIFYETPNLVNGYLLPHGRIVSTSRSPSCDSASAPVVVPPRSPPE